MPEPYARDGLLQVREIQIFLLIMLIKDKMIPAKAFAFAYYAEINHWIVQTAQFRIVKGFGNYYIYLSSFSRARVCVICSLFRSPSFDAESRWSSCLHLKRLNGFARQELITDVTRHSFPTIARPLAARSCT